MQQFYFNLSGYRSLDEPITVYRAFIKDRTGSWIPLFFYDSTSIIRTLLNIVASWSLLNTYIMFLNTRWSKQKLMIKSAAQTNSLIKIFVMFFFCTCKLKTFGNQTFFYKKFIKSATSFSKILKSSIWMKGFRTKFNNFSGKFKFYIKSKLLKTRWFHKIQIIVTVFLLI